jgi:hypothetical protein
VFPSRSACSCPTTAGFSVDVLDIHHEDRFVEGVPPNRYPLAPGNDGTWSADITFARQEETHFGLSGRYLYRYRLRRGSTAVTEWFTDPFAYATDDVGALAAFDAPDSMAPYGWHNDTWKVPELRHCASLPPTNGGVRRPVSKQLVDACHAADIAVILDVVFQHTAETFPYYRVYVDANQASGVPAPLSRADSDRRARPLRAFVVALFIASESPCCGRGKSSRITTCSAGSRRGGSRAALRSWNWFYYCLQSRPGSGDFAYHRFEENEHAIVILNFSDSKQSVTVPAQRRAPTPNWSMHLTGPPPNRL